MAVLPGAGLVLGLRWGRARAAAACVLGAALVVLVVPGVGGAEEAPAVTISAAAGWGHSTPGAWTPYVVTVNNDGPGDIDGDVVLVPEPAPPPRPGAAPSQAGGPQSVLTLQGRVIAPPAKDPGGPVLKAPGLGAVYRTPVSLAAGAGEKTLTTLVVESPFGYHAELRDSADRLVASSPPSPLIGAPPPPNNRPQGGPYTVALLSSVAAGDAVLKGLPGHFGSQLEVTRIAAARDFPDSVLLMSGLRAVVIDDFNTVALAPDQIQALTDFVALGGSLVLSGGAAAQQNVSGLPPELAPLRPTATALTPLGPLADLGGFSSQATATVAVGDLRGGRSVIQARDGSPLVVEADHGSGKVVQLAYDPLAEPFASDPALSALGWEQGLARGLARWNRFSQHTVGTEEQLWSPVLDRPRPPWPAVPSWVLALLAGQVLVGAVVAVALRSRSRRRPFLVWAVVPAVALVATGVIGASGGLGPSGGSDRVVEVRTIGPGGTVMLNAYRGIGGLLRGERTVDVGPGVAAASLLTQPSPSLRSQAQEIKHFGQSTRGPGGGEVDTASRRVLVNLGGSRAAEIVQSVQTMRIERARGGFESQLKLSPASARGDRRISGTVTNSSDSAVAQLRVQLVNGAQGHLAELIEPGATVQVDVPVLPANLGTVGPSTVALAPSEERVMFAAASRSFTAMDQVALVGLGPTGTGRPGGPEPPLRVMVQTVPFEQAQTSNAPAGTFELYPSRLSRPVSTFQVSSGDWVNVYDMPFTPPAKPTFLDYSPDMTAPPLEIYNGLSNTWRPLPREQLVIERGATYANRTVPLMPGEGELNLVRLRARTTLAAATQATLLLDGR